MGQEKLRVAGGYWVDAAGDSAGNQYTSPATLLSGEDDEADRMMVEFANQGQVITSATGGVVTVSSSKAYIHGVFVNVVKATGDILEIFDDNDPTSGGGGNPENFRFTINLAVQGFHPIGCRTVNGIVTKATLAGGASANATIIFRKLA